MRLHKLLTGGLAAVALTAAIGGAALAQTPAPTQTGIQQRGEELLNAFAAKLGKTPAEVRAAIAGVQKDRVAADVAAGRLTQQQADQLNQRIDQAGGLGFGLFKPGFGGRGHHGFGGPGPGLHGLAGADVATFLGIRRSELMRALAGGKSLAQVAQEKGKSRDELKAYITAQNRTELDQAVAAGRLTQSQADQRLANLTAQLDQMIDRTGTARPQRGPGGPGPGRGAPPRGTGA